jgi:hypothetical protein
LTEKERLAEDIRLVRNIDFTSTDKDNMEFQAYATCFQLEALSRLVDMVEFKEFQLNG